MKKLFLFAFVLLGLAAIANAQVVFTEDFNYTVGSALTGNGYAAHSGAGANSLTIMANSLTYTGYSDGVGGMLATHSSGEDVNKKFITNDSINSGSIYLACLVKVDSAKAGGDYFIHLASPTMLTSTYYIRVFVKMALNNKLAFGIAKATVTAGVTPKYTDSIYTLGTTYLLVAKYQFVNGTNKDDIVSFWVNPTLGPEPTPLISYVDEAANATDITSFGSICFRQGSAANGVAVFVDGVKISKSWIGGGSTPVELSAFSAMNKGNDVVLSWSTATETNNQKFVVEKRINGQWTAIGSVAGNGTSTTIHNYSFTDNNVKAVSEYRLQQVDFDGSVHYSNIIESEAAVNGFALAQNYPNPFNPSTVISYQLASAGNVSLKVYDVLGNEVATLINGHQEAGAQSVTFDASKLSAGVYVYKLQTGSFSATKKLMLVK